MALSASPKKASASPNKTQDKEKEKAKKVKKEVPPAGKDIRNFFGGPYSGGPSKPPISKAAGTGKQPINIDDSDDDIEQVEAKPTVKTEHKPTSTTSKHFPPKPALAKQPTSLDGPLEPLTPPGTRSKPTSKSAKMKRKGALVHDSDSEEDVKPAAKGKSVGGRAVKIPTYDESLSDEDQKLEMKPAPKARAKGEATKKEPSPMDVDDSSDEEDLKMEDEVEDEDDDDVPSKGKKGKSKAKPKAATKKTTPAKNPPAKKEPAKKATPKKAQGDEVQKEEKPKYNFAAAAARKAAGPKAPGSKEIPEGAPDCLAGLTFVFTGELESLGRDQAIEIAKKFGGKVTTAPSSKTSYVVLGEDAGPSKLKKIEDHNLKTLNEDEFLALIESRQGAEMDDKAIKAKEKEDKKIADQAKEMDRREKEDEKLRKRKEEALEGTGIAAKRIAPISAQLWTTKYAPQNMKEVCGNKAPVERLGQWLSDWQKNLQSGFKKPGKNGMGIYRAVLISGPPGIGKTTSAHLVAKMAGYSPIEMNASDARSKKLIESGTNIDNTSLDGFFHRTGMKSTTVIGDVKVDHRTCLIFDEVDGMSGGDRGGIGAMNALIKKTRIPMILICNDRTLQKMKPFQHTTFNMGFRRPGPAEVRSRIMSILYKEKMKIPPNVVDQLVQGANSDIRQVLNMLSTFKLGKNDMDFEEGKALLKVNEKNTLMTPFTIIDKLCNPYAFSRTNKDTFNEKMELYFHDFSFVPLFMQEHFIMTDPSNTKQYEGPEKNAKHLELLSKAADSISDGDLIDRMIHGSEQHWSLLPQHAFASTIRPAYYVYGPMRNTGGPGSWGPSFPQWLGQNSKQNKLQRQLTDIQIRMRLKASGSRQEIREQYMPMLSSRIVSPLLAKGTDAVEETIEYMDEYYLGKEDWEAFVELGVDAMNGDMLMKKIPTATKTAFTRQYNKSDHPIAFHRGDMFAASKKKIADMGPVPDNEDVIEEDEPVQDDTSEKADNEGDDEINDVSKDKLIKAVKPKAAGKGKATEKGKKK